MEPLEGLRAAMAAVDAYYKERGIFQGRFGFGQCPALALEQARFPSLNEREC
jgi:hypothetical protein